MNISFAKGINKPFEDYLKSLTFNAMDYSQNFAIMQMECS